MSTPVWKRITGLVNGFLKFGFRGPHVAKNATQDNQLDIMANDGVADGRLKVAAANVKTVEVFDGNINKTVISMPLGAAGDLVFKLPVNLGNPGDALVTDGAGQLAFSNAGGAADLTTKDYDLLFNSASPMNLVNLTQANMLVSKIVIIVSTPFNGTGPVPTLQIGISGDIAKFVEAADVDLTNAGSYEIDVEQYQVTAAQMIATFTAAGTGGTTGAAKIVTVTSKPD